VLMNSAWTDTETKKVIEKYKDRNIKIYTFEQRKFPRLYKDTRRPVPKNTSNLKEWYPPGSGDIYESFYNSGLMEKFINEGKEFAFLSNVENFGGNLGKRHMKLLNLICTSDYDFLTEVAERLITDHLGGIFVADDRTHSIRLLELSQVPLEYVDHFKANKFMYWNTNSLWVRLSPLQKKIKSGEFTLGVIANTRSVDGKNYVQLEMPAATAVQSFSKCAAVIVPRSRYLEVKTTADLFVLQSNIYSIDSDGRYAMNPARVFPTSPIVKLGEQFSSYSEYMKRFGGSLPNILELDHLTVSGNVYFGKGIELKGNVIIVANHGEQISIPDGATLENKIIAGNMRILDH